MKGKEPRNTGESSFRKKEDRTAGPRGGGYSLGVLYSSLRVESLYVLCSDSIEVYATQDIFDELRFRDEAEFKGNGRHHEEAVYITCVIGHDNAGPSTGQVFLAMNDERRESSPCEEAGSPPHKFPPPGRSRRQNDI